MHTMFRLLPVIAAVTLAVGNAAGQSEGASNVQLEALKRLQGVDLEANPSLKAAVVRIVDTTRGTPQFVDLVEQFKLAGQEAGLLEVAVKFPSEESGARAMGLLLTGEGLELLKVALAPGDPRAAACVQALGNTRVPAINALVLPNLTNAAAADALSREAVKALAKNEPGARILLELAGRNALPEAAQLTAATALSQVAWPEVRAEAARLLPLPKAGGDETLPTIVELAKRAGDATAGEAVYFSDTTACHRCHQVKGRGTMIGPDLTQIGDKLGKDALLEAILDPNNGIAFGYEAWNVTKSGDEEIYGLIVSETADELVLKDLSGIVHRLRKSEITSRVGSKFSLMPSGLQATMSVQQLVDLVEYLSRLRKPVGAP